MIRTSEGKETSSEEKSVSIPFREGVPVAKSPIRKILAGILVALMVGLAIGYEAGSIPITGYREQITSLQNELRSIEQQYNFLNASFQDLQRENDDLRNDYASLNANFANLVARVRLCPFHTELVKSGTDFIVPKGKVYEVYVSLELEGQGVALIPDSMSSWGANITFFGLCLQDGLAPDWLPRGSNTNTIIKWLENGTGGYDAGLQQLNSQMASEGWILTELERLRAQGSYDFLIRWRERPDLGSA